MPALRRCHTLDFNAGEFVAVEREDNCFAEADFAGVEE